jgi:hypothetical protein
MIDYLTYYYTKGTEPFRSLSALSDSDAIRIMKALYVEFNESILFERFKDPARYLEDRRQTEHWVREAFIAKGGTPQEAYPISMVLGASAWISQWAPDLARHAEIRIPLSVFEDGDVSFTFPDSMVSRWLGTEKLESYYLPAYHNKVFTRSEILAIVGEHGLPEETWDVQLPDNVGAYIEAQVWNHTALRKYNDMISNRL